MTDSPHSKDDLAVLLARVEAAKGPDSEIDLMVWRYLHGFDPFKASFSANTDPIEQVTRSIDTAWSCAQRKLKVDPFLMLDGPRAYLNIPTPVPNHWRAVLSWGFASTARSTDGWGATAPLAILAALMKALLLTEKD